MRPIATDVAHSVVAVSVCGLGKCPTKSDEPTEMPFRGQTHVDHPKEPRGVYTGAIRRIGLNENDPCATAMWPCVKFVSYCYYYINVTHTHTPV